MPSTTRPMQFAKYRPWLQSPVQRKWSSCRHAIRFGACSGRKKLANLLMSIREDLMQVRLHEPAIDERLANPTARPIVNVIADPRAAILRNEIVPMNPE